MAKKSEYWELLRDPRWQKRRLEIMQRDEFTCQQCFDAESTLNVHHRVYVKGKMPWEYPDAALVTLCESCHAEESQVSQSIQDLLITLWPNYSPSQDTARLGKLASFLTVSMNGGWVSPYNEEAWMASIAAVSGIFANTSDPESTEVVLELLLRFRADATKRLEERKAGE